MGSCACATCELRSTKSKGRKTHSPGIALARYEHVSRQCIKYKDATLPANLHCKTASKSNGGEHTRNPERKHRGFGLAR